MSCFLNCKNLDSDSRTYISRQAQTDIRMSAHTHAKPTHTRLSASQPANQPINQSNQNVSLRYQYRDTDQDINKIHRHTRTYTHTYTHTETCTSPVNLRPVLLTAFRAFLPGFLSRACLLSPELAVINVILPARLLTGYNCRVSLHISK